MKPIIKPEKRIRGPNLVVLVKKSSLVPFEEGLMQADGQNRVIASNKRLSKALADRVELRGIKDALSCWSGTMTAYEKPEKKFGETVEYITPQGQRWVFHVPKQFQGEANAIFVAEHPYYTIEINGRNRVVQATNVDLVREFPTQADGWHKGDPKYDIPQGDRLDYDDPDVRFFLIRNQGERVGPVFRDYTNYKTRGRIVDISGSPSVDRGMAVEAP